VQRATRQRRQQVRDRLRADIVAAAIDVFARAGSGAQMRDIADAADVAVGSLYAHFPDKDALLTAVMDELMRRVWEDLVPMVRAAGPVLERMARITRYRCEKWREHAPYFVAFSEACARVSAGAGANDSRTEAICGWLERFHAISLELIKEGVASGELRADIPSDVINHAWDGLVTQNLVRPGHPPGPTAKRIGDALVAIIQQAFAANPGAKVARSAVRARPAKKTSKTTKKKAKK
jgi:AcrR family transcriptional regulator